MLSRARPISKTFVTSIGSIGKSRYLIFNVREPFPSKTSGAEVIHGKIEAKNPLEIVSLMPQNGVIFSDGIEEDRLEFNSGTTAKIGLSERTLRLVVPEQGEPNETMPRDWAGANQASDREKHDRQNPRGGSRPRGRHR